MGEFIGLAYFSTKGAEILRKTFSEYRSYKGNFHEADSFSAAFLTDMLQELVERGIKIEVVEIQGEWATLDSPQDLTQFIFGTKAETLERLQPLLQGGKICDQIRFEVDEWVRDREYWVNAIQQRFEGKNIIVRSSAIAEDS